MNDASADHRPDSKAVEAFIGRWQDTGSKKRANEQPCPTETCQSLTFGYYVQTQIELIVDQHHVE